MNVKIDAETAHEIANLVDGVFHPVREFMDGQAYSSVVNSCKLLSGESFPLPIVFAPELDEGVEVRAGDTINAILDGRSLATLEVTDTYTVDLEHDLSQLFGTDSTSHPGVVNEVERPKFRIGARIASYDSTILQRDENYHTPAQVKAICASRGIESLAGFQTRNAVHRAHEHLIRVAMEVADGVLIQPLIGKRKAGDFTGNAIIHSYQALLEHFLPADRVIFSTWQTTMRYAGPREAALHMLVRRNFGCSHFVVGRDQAGVGNFYGKYEAQELCKQFSVPEIQALPLAGPFFCSACDDIVNEKTCKHYVDEPGSILEVSGTRIRSLLSQGQRPESYLMRPQVADRLLELGKKEDLFL